ncbi:MAG: hypothetical protein JWQ14_2524, partial [Adhaeribacter sp.]|nr:hypothetical protein [Adhaeribacter sp.]
ATSGHGGETAPGGNRQVYGAYWDKNSFSERDKNRFTQEHREHRQEPNRDLRREENNQDDDSRYEIYDTTQNQYNSVPEQSTISYNQNQRIDDDNQRNQHNYGSRERPRYRYGSGNEQDHNYNDNLNEGNMAGSLSWGYDGNRGYGDDDRNRRYDPMSGSINRDPSRNRDDRENRDRPRGGYDGNNRHRDDRNQNR